jgi:pimeloyl-ACP methyl ester carboxylesterase
MRSSDKFLNLADVTRSPERTGTIGNRTMNNHFKALSQSGTASSVIALHCSLGSGRQWDRLALQLGSRHQVIAPDISGYGSNAGSLALPTTLVEEIDALSPRLGEDSGPLHIVGHSYGGALAFKIVTDPRYARRVRSLTLIEPVLPTILMENGSDRRLYEHFARLAYAVYEDLWKGSSMEAIEKFLTFWRGSGPDETLSSNALGRLVEHAEKLAFDFTAILAERNVTPAAAAIRVPTLLISGGLSPYLTQRVVGRLASTIPGAETKYLPAAGHMLAISHASSINPDIVRHIARADELANLTLAVGEFSDETLLSVKS